MPAEVRVVAPGERNGEEMDVQDLVDKTAESGSATAKRTHSLTHRTHNMMVKVNIQRLGAGKEARTRCASDYFIPKR